MFTNAFDSDVLPNFINSYDYMYKLQTINIFKEHVIFP